MNGLRHICVIAAIVCGVSLAPPARGGERPGEAASRPATEAALAETLRQAQALQAQGKLPEAVAQYEKAVEISEAVHGKDHLTTAEMLRLVADQRKAAGDYGKAVPLWDRILKTREAKLGSDRLEVAQALFELGWLHANMGARSGDKAQFTQAEPLFLRCLKIREAKLAKDHGDVAMALHELGWVCLHTGRYAEAEPLFARNLRIREANSGRDDLWVAWALGNLATLHKRTKEYSKAEAFYLRILKIKETELGKEHLQVADCMEDLASLYDEMGQQAKAESHRRRSQEIRKAQPSKEHQKMVSDLEKLAARHLEAGEPAEAIAVFHQLINIQERELGKDHPDVAMTLDDLGSCYAEMREYAKAEPLLLRSLAIFEAKLGKDHPEVARIANNLGTCYLDTGEYAKAEPLYLRSLEISEAKLGKDHPDVAMSLNNLASLYNSMGEYAKAEPLQLRSLAIREAKLGKDHPSVAWTLINLAEHYESMGQYAKAESMYRRSLEIREAKLGKDHPHVTMSLDALAGLYHDMGEYAKAEPLYLRSLAIKEAKLGKDHPDVARSLSSLAGLYQSMGEYAKAEPLHRRSLEIREAKLSKDLPDVADSLHGLAHMYEYMGDYAKAEPLYLRSLAIYEAKLGLNHFRVAKILADLAWTYTLSDQPARAWPLLERSAKVLASARVRAGRSALARSSFYAKHTQEGFAPSLALRLQKDVDVLQLLEAQRAMGLRELLAEAKLEAATVLDEADGRRVTLALARINALNAAIDKRAGLGRPADDLNEDLLRAERQYEALMAEVRTGHEQYAAAETAQAISSEQAVLSPALDDQTAIVGWIELAPKKWLWGYVIRTSGVHWVDLSEGYDPSADRELMGRVLAWARGSRQEGAASSARDLAAFYRRRFGPLEPHLKGARKLIVIAQDWAAHLPIEMLLTAEPAEGAPMSDWPWLAGKYQVSYAPSVTTLDILCRQREQRKGKQWSRPLLALADPPFNAEQLAAMETKQATPTGEPLAAAGADGEASLQRAVRFDPKIPLSRLPGTRREAQLIAGALGVDRCLLLLGPEACERRLFELNRAGELGKCRYVHLATHGFADAERPELSGLVLARVPADPDYDGVLHMREVFHLKLQADLVVLSACQTGLGRDLSGEGVVGLSTAFFFAGTPSLVMSLWNVPDAPTALLMQRFYRNLAAGQTKATALQEAKTWLRNLTREDLAKLGRADAQIAQLTRGISGAPTTAPKGRQIEDRPFAHPHCWAGFILTGDPK